MKVTHAIKEAIERAEADGRIAKTERNRQRTRQFDDPPSLVGWPWSIKLVIPCKVVSEMNTRGHWAVRHKRFQVQAAAVDLAWITANLKRGWIVTDRLVITLTRIGRPLDSDNLAGAFKAVRDRIAYLIALDDADSRLTWQYEQKQGKSGNIEVLIESRKP